MYPDRSCAAALRAHTRLGPSDPDHGLVPWSPVRPPCTVVGDPVQMPAPGPDQRSRNRRPRRRGQSSCRAPVTEFEEQQELEAARERNDLDISDLREMSVNELRQVGRELELDTAVD